MTNNNWVKVRIPSRRNYQVKTCKDIYKRVTHQGKESKKQIQMKLCKGGQIIKEKDRKMTWRESFISLFDFCVYV